MPKARDWKRVPWFDIMDLVRTDLEHQGQQAKIAVFRGGTKKENKSAANAYRLKVRRWLLEYFPDEDWGLSDRLEPDTWGDYFLAVTYRGKKQVRRRRAS